MGNGDIGRPVMLITNRRVLACVRDASPGADPRNRHAARRALAWSHAMISRSGQRDGGIRTVIIFKGCDEVMSCHCAASLAAPEVRARSAHNTIACTTDNIISIYT